MLRWAMFIIGWLLLAGAGLNIAVKVLGSPEAVALYAGSSRDLNLPFWAVIAALVLLALVRIMDELEAIRNFSKD